MSPLRPTPDRILIVAAGLKKLDRIHFTHTVTRCLTHQRVAHRLYDLTLQLPLKVSAALHRVPPVDRALLTLINRRLVADVRRLDPTHILVIKGSFPAPRDGGRVGATSTHRLLQPRQPVLAGRHLVDEPCPRRRPVLHALLRVGRAGPRACPRGGWKRALPPLWRRRRGRRAKRRPAALSARVCRKRRSHTPRRRRSARPRPREKRPARAPPLWARVAGAGGDAHQHRPHRPALRRAAPAKRDQLESAPRAQRGFDQPSNVRGSGFGAHDDPHADGRGHVVFPRGEEAEYFDDAEECADKIAWYTEHDEARERMARAAYRRVFDAHHTAADRIESLVETLCST